MRKSLSLFFRFVKQVITEYIADNVLKYSASLAYYTTLSLAPMLIIVISVSGFLFGEEAMRGEVYNEIRGLVGNRAAEQIQVTMQNIHLSPDTSFSTIISLVVLLIGATGIFGEIQDSLNKIWGLKTINVRVWWKLLIDRLVSFSLIISLGFVMVVSLLLSAIVTAVSSRIAQFLVGTGEVVLIITDNLLSVAVTTGIFAIIFKVLPDAKIKWRDVIIGSLITSILFMVGKIMIGYYLGRSNLASVFGAAGSVIIIMIWVYYSSAILYLGSVFTKVYATNHGGKIQPNEYSVWVKIEEKPVSKVTLHE